MSTDRPPQSPGNRPKRSRSVRLFLKGLAVTLPSILTLVILVWLGQLVYGYIIHPVSDVVRYSFAFFVNDAQPADDFVSWNKLPELQYVGTDYVVEPEFKEQLQGLLQTAEDNGAVSEDSGIPVGWVKSSNAVFVPVGRQAVPYEDYRLVAEQVPASEMPRNAAGIYRELVTIRYFGSLLHLSAVAVILVILLLYFLGGIFTARMGGWAVNKFETAILARVPVISNVYSSVKQVTDFVFTEHAVEYNRVVAVEYPRRGIWSIGFVTSDSMIEITAAAGEPMLTLLMPTSPMPMTGFTINVPRSEVIDLDITIDQAFQFFLSCGVLIPPRQKVTPELLQEELAKRLAGLSDGGTARPQGPPPPRSNGEPDGDGVTRPDEPAAPADEPAPERSGEEPS